MESRTVVRSRSPIRPGASALLIQLDQEPSEAAIGLLLGVEAEAARHQGQWWIRLPSPDAASPALLGALGGRRWIPDVDSDAAAAAACVLGDAANTSGAVAGVAAGRAPDYDGPRLVLRTPGRSVPTASVQAVMPWQPVAELFAVRLPTAAVAAARPSRDRLRLCLIRGGPQRPPAALEVTLDQLCAWVGGAPRVRLQGLRWLRRGEHALVLGQPLPPLTGRSFVAKDRLLFPAGFHWQPPVSAATVLAACRGATVQNAGRAARQAEVEAAKAEVEAAEADDDWLIWESNDRWSRVDDSAWAALSRGGVRAAGEGR